MEDSGRPSAFDPRHLPRSGQSLHATNPDRQEEHHQEQSGVPSPLVSPTSSVSRSLAPAPAVIPHQPALWQLGRHSRYASGDDNTQSVNDTHEDRSPSSPTTDFQKDVKQVPFDLEGTNEAQLRDVEEELHRGLMARQVRHTNFTMRNLLK